MTAEKAAILLVDDQDRNLDALEAILDSSDCRLVRARSADEALLALLKGDFSAIVCDIKMPGIGGIELAQMIKERKRTRHIPILFLTAHQVEETDLLRGYGAGAVDYLSKPINPEILRSKLGVFVELFQKTRELEQANLALAEEVSQRQRAQEALRVAKEELERRVGERTAELVSANQALRQSEDRMALAMKSAESANRAKDHFLAVLSHELRTPLTPVMATVHELLRAPELSPALRDDLDLIHRNVELEARLIDDLLDLTRIARGKMELQKSSVEVHHILEHAPGTCAPDFRDKQITLHVSLDAKLSFVLGDRARLLQIFWNLLKNAAKFTPPGQSVAVRTSNPSPGQLRIEVVDNGIGIDAARLATIFNAFEQGSTEMTRQYGGLGLGLSIGKALVDLHGGTISAASGGIDKGASFSVQLPLAAAQSVLNPSPDSPAAGPQRNQTQKPATPFRLLLVEDHPDTSRVMERLLRGVGYEVTAANGVNVALGKIQQANAHFDAVISDIGLPDGSGLDLMRQIRARFPTMPAIALSGFGMEEDRRRSHDAGFAAHLTKPVDLGALQSTLEKVLSTAESRATT